MADISRLSKYGRVRRQVVGTLVLLIAAAVSFPIVAIGEQGQAKEKNRGSLSPDGKLAVYVDTKDGDAEIYIANADGTDERQLTKNNSIDNFPQWFPDGRKILWASNRSGKWQLYTMKSDGQEVVQLTDDKVGAWKPSISAMGQVAYVASRSRRGKKSFSDLILLENGTSRVLVKNVEVHSHRWSPDGKTIAIGGTGKVWLYTVDGEGVAAKAVDIANTNSELSAYAAYSPRWREDSQMVAFEFFLVGGTGTDGPFPPPGGQYLISLDGMAQKVDAEKPPEWLEKTSSRWD